MPQEGVIIKDGIGRQGTGSPGSPHERRLRLVVAAAAFLALFVLTFILTGPGNGLWPLVTGALVGGAGGAGAYGLLSGRSSRLKRLATDEQDQHQDLMSRLTEIDQLIRDRAHQFPPSTQGQMRMMVAGLREVVDRWNLLRRFPEQQDAVHRTVTHHFPETLSLFLKLPDDEKPRYAQEFKGQIGLMAEAIAKTRDMVVAKNLQQLRTHRWLLEDSLVDPDEKLFRDQGL